MSDKRTGDDYDKLRREFLEWMLLDRVQRGANNLPKSEAEWARRNGLTPRALYNWKNDEAFQAQLEKRRAEAAQRILTGDGLVGPRVFAVHDDSAESDYAQIKSKLIAQAAAGDKQSLDLYFKTFGKAFVDEETAARKSDFREWSDEHLKERLLALLDDDTLFAECEVRQANIGE